jgi:glycosyltransferase involved in cell wall biosynthesis
MSEDEARIPTPGTSRICVVIPCHDEESTIGRVVSRFLETLPEAEILVVDNASGDGTARCAAAAGARVIGESRVGKGFALAAGFEAARPADFYVMVDGDDTYPASQVGELLRAADDGADMVVGTRLNPETRDAFPTGHGFGNRLFVWLARLLFGIRTHDLFSGYRVLSRRFLETAPLISTGFDIEAELSVQAQVNGFRVEERAIDYRPRPAGSNSKLHTLRDGYRILRGLLTLFRDYRPIACFGWLAAMLGLASLASGWAPVDDYIRTGLVHHLPRAVLAAGLFILAALSMSLGILLASINRRSTQLAALIRKHSR